MKAQKTKLKIRSKNQFLIIVWLLITILGCFMIYDYHLNRTLKKIEDESIKDFFEDSIVDKKEIEIEDLKEEQISTTKIDYNAILEIPKINLKRGLVDKNSSDNDVNKNICILKETIFPDENESSHIILAAHSGNSSVSYFKNLNKLSLNDEVYFYYENIKYIYKISRRYEIEKNGKMKFNLAYESDITLITCIDGTEKQVVFIGKLISKEDY